MSCPVVKKDVFQTLLMQSSKTTSRPAQVAKQTYKQYEYMKNGMK